MTGHGGEAPEFHERHSHCDGLLSSLAGATVAAHELELTLAGDIRAAVLTFSDGRRVKVEPWGSPMSFEELEPTDATGPAPKDRMVIACCGCGRPVDMPAVARLERAEPSRISYLASCPNCGLTHRITAARA